MVTNPNPAAQVIGSILKHDQKVNSYKIALLRAINDVVLEFPDLASQHKDIAVPLRVLAEYWLSYYWPFMDPANPIYQGPRAVRKGSLINDVAFRPKIESVFHEWEKVLGADTANYSDGFFIRNEMRIARKRKEYPKEFVSQYQSAISKISSSIKMPIRYAGEGEWQVFSAPQKFSALKDVTTPLPSTKAGDVCLVIPSQLWLGFHQLSLYIEALAIHQWSLFLEQVKQSDNISLDRGQIYEILTTRPDNRRPLTWERNRIDVLLMEGHQFRCPWTNISIVKTGAYDVDHIIPVSLYPINELWNLVPSDPDFNAHKKRDRLPGQEALGKAAPIISDTYANYLIDKDLANALQDDATNRFSKISVTHFSLDELTDSMVAFVNSIQVARNVATF